MNRSVVRFLRWISISSWVTAAWTETSGRDRLVGDHHLRVAGERAGDADRCFWPPESWRGRR